MKSNKFIGSADMLPVYLQAMQRESDVLRRLREETARLPTAVMQVPPEQGQLMAFLVKALNVRTALELGTFTGYSALCVAQALPEDGQLITCDIGPRGAAMGRRYWEEAGVAGRIDFRPGKAQDLLDSLLADGQAGRFDFAFVDADKLNQDSYYEAILVLLRSGGVMLIDNVLLSGAVLSMIGTELSGRTIFSAEEIAAVHKLNQKVHADERVDQVMLPLADGLTLVRKR